MGNRRLKKFLSKESTMNFLSWFALRLVKLVYFFTFVEYRNIKKLQDYLNSGKPVILVFWHSRCFLISKLWRDKIGMKKHPIYGIFSTHRDGQLIGKLFEHLGVKNIISSSKNVMQARAVVMKSLKLLKQGVSIGFTPDGPVGPRMHMVSDSAFVFAKASGAPIVPVYISAKNPIIFNSWDRFVLEKPFHKAVMKVGDFLFVDRNISADDLEKVKVDFERQMVYNTLQLDRELGMPEILPADVSDSKKKKK